MGMIGNSLAQGLISGANIQDGTVDTPDLKDGAVTAAKIADGAAVPSQTGQSGKYLTTDGSTASWGTVNTDLVSDTTPQLGGNLDLNSNNITGAGSIQIEGANNKISTNSNHLILHDTAETDTGTNWWYIYRSGGDGNLKFYRNSSVRQTFTSSGGITATSLTANTADFSSGTSHIELPQGTTAQRPTGAAGMMRYNSTTGGYEVYNTSIAGWIRFDNLPNDGSSSAQAITNGQELTQYATSSGTYYVQTSSMASAVQCYVDAATHSEPMVRIFLANTNNYTAGTSSYDVADIATDCKEFVYAFCNPSTNALTQAWTFRFTDTSRVSTSSASNAGSFRSTNPMLHGGSGSPLISQVFATQISSGSTITTYLRTGISSFGSQCDDTRSGTWGNICLKAGNTSATGSGGYSDFPHFATFYNSGTDHCSRSDQAYSTTQCSSTRRFAIYVTL